MNLRELYKEKGIKNINTAILEKRENSLQEILENVQLKDKEWELLANWLIGIAEEDEKVENILIKLEEIFCKQDELFSKENEKEMQILVGELIYRYCQEKKEKKIPLMFLCGYNVGYKVKSEKLYQRFVHILNEWRLIIRGEEESKDIIEFPDTAKIRNEVTTKQKEAEDEGVEWNADQENWNSMFELLESFEKVIYSLNSMSNKYKTMLEVQREESDILWWMINEWSDIYEQPFRTLSEAQIVLVAPIELKDMIRYSLGPFAIKQVLYKEISLVQNKQKRITLSQLVNAADEKLLDKILDEWNSSRVQPILLALQDKKKAGDEGWKNLFTRACDINPDEFEKTLEEFSYQFYLELELTGLMVK